MTIQLSSLRVAADFDPTSYKRGMDQKVAADKAGSESSKAFGASLAQADAAMDKTSNGSVRLSRALVDGYANAAKFESTMRSLGRSVDRGMDLERAGILLDATYKKYGLVADAMSLVKQGHVQLAPVVSTLNQRLEIQAAVAQRASDAARKLAAAQVSQMSINGRLGVLDQGSSTERGADVAAYGRELDILRAKYNPLFAASQQYIQVVEEIRRAHSVGAISADEMAAALQRETLAAQNSIAAIRQRNASIAQAAQASINKQLGVFERGDSGAREADIVAYGRQLDSLRAKYNPLYAAIQQYKSAQADIREANAIGAISTDEMTAALNRERKAALESVAALKQRGVVSGGARSYQTANIAAQFQDIAVTSAMGMSPIQIALQQGTQLSAVFNEMGRGRDVIAGIGQAFMSIVSPVSLVTIGTIAAGAALLQYVASSNQVKSIDEILAVHEQNIKRLGPAYEEALQKQKKYVVEDPLVVNIDFAEDQRLALERRAIEARKAMDRIIAGTWQDTGGDQYAVNKIFQPAEQAIQQFVRSVYAGAPQVARFREEIGKLYAGGQLTVQAARSLSEYTKSAYEAETKTGDVSSVVDRYAASIQNMETTLQRLQPNRTNRELQGLWEKFKDGELSAQRLLTAINNLSFASPDLRDARAEILRLVEAMQLAKETATGFANTTPKSDLGYDPSQANRPLSDLNFNSRFGAENEALNRLKSQKRELEKQPKKSAAERQAERDANAYRDLVKSAQDRIDQMGLEEQLVGKTGVAADAYRMKLELVQKAQDKGRTLSDDHRKELERLADTYGKAAERVAALSLAEELRFEHDQLFRSSTEQRVASTLRSSGIDPLSSQGQLLAGQIRLNEQLAENKDMALSFGQSLVSAFDDGKITIEELGKAGLSVLDRLVDKMLNDVINAIMQVGQAGAGIGGGGGLFGFLGGLFGGGSGTSFFPSAPGVGLYANGGVFPNRLSSFSGNFTNQIVSKPTMFAFAKGVGLMGEAGEEAIMPLARGSDGSLGVRTYGRSATAEAGGSSSDGRTVIVVELSPDLVGQILEQSGKQAVSIVQQNDENHQNRRQNGDSW
jgi:Prophage tail length tape measure protein